MQGNRKKVLWAAVFLLINTAFGYAAERHALVFGLGKQEDVRWGRIHGDNDVLYIKQMLFRMGYTDIRVLTNERATKAAMVDAFIDLALRCKRGDEVYVHYSGHGQLMTDLNGDERLKWSNAHADWDESWIPYDAYMTYGPEDRGEKHLCDDEVALFLQAIRQKIGRRGRLVVVVDACHSGDATAAGEDEEECVRGVDTKFCIPRDPDAPQAETPGEENWRTVSACKPHQLSTEIKERQVGKLTFALFSTEVPLFEASNEELEQVLSEFMERHRGRLAQTPMVTGKVRGEREKDEKSWLQFDKDFFNR